MGMVSVLSCQLNRFTTRFCHSCEHRDAASPEFGSQFGHEKLCHLGDLGNPLCLGFLLYKMEIMISTVCKNLV